MPDPEWHAGKLAIHLLNIKLDFIRYKQAAMKASIEDQTLSICLELWVTELTEKCKQNPPTNVLAKVFPQDDVEFSENDVTAVVFSLFFPFKSYAK